MNKISKEKRSEIMSKIRSKNTKVEVLVFRELKNRGVYFQKHYGRVVGSPDIALPRKKKAVFIDGDFWHGYNYKILNKIPSPKEYWVPKLERNIFRDEETNQKLKSRGWEVLRVWENQLNNKNFTTSMELIVNFLTK